VLGGVLDVFRLRQYFDVAVRVRDVVRGVRDDAWFLDDVRRALVALPIDRWPAPVSPLPPVDLPAPRDRRTDRVALLATGGSGALASVVGAARAFEERGLEPALISTCSGSALFGFPLAAGIPSDDVAAFVLGLRPRDYVDVDWRRLAVLLPTAGRGFAGIIRGDRLEATYHELLGDLALGELPIPAYAPIWNIEENRVEYLGPDTYPELTVARAVRMAVSLPLFIQPVPLAGYRWCDGGIVDIFPVVPVLEHGRDVQAAVAINCFYTPDFAGEDVTGWEEKALSIIEVASQVRTCQQQELARVNVARLRSAMPVAMIEPVPYEKVRGLGFYRQFLDNTEWPEFVRAGREAGLRALDVLAPGDAALGAPVPEPAPAPAPRWASAATPV
jgi:NTE family protein